MRQQSVLSEWTYETSGERPWPISFERVRTLQRKDMIVSLGGVCKLYPMGIKFFYIHTGGVRKILPDGNTARRGEQE